MIVIIAGSRDIDDLDLVMDAIDRSAFEFTEVRSGMARGVDTAAMMKPWACVVRKFHANWKRYGKQAGYLRNEAMERGMPGCQPADALIAIPRGASPGTRHMISIMQRAGKPVEIPLVVSACGFPTDG